MVEHIDIEKLLQKSSRMTEYGKMSIYKPRSMNRNATYKCSVCGKLCSSYYNDVREWKFCPHCGAKMDSEGVRDEQKKRQIEELAEAIFQNGNYGLFFSEAEKIARFVIEERGYRKQSKVAMEIIGEILSSHTLDIDGFFTMHESELTELKKKYTEESGNDR